MIRFEWDEAKNKKNRQKHGIWFEEAQSVFDDPFARVFYDFSHSDDEDRYLIIGMSTASRILILVHGFRNHDSVVRIISARKATRKEREVYEERI